MLCLRGIHSNAHSVNSEFILSAHWVNAEWISAYAQTLRKFVHSIGISMKNEVQRKLSLRKMNYSLYCVNSQWISAHSQSTQDKKITQARVSFEENLMPYWRSGKFHSALTPYSMCESDLRFADLDSPYAELTGNQIPRARNQHRTCIARRKWGEEK